MSPETASSAPNEIIGVLGGTFDPVHVGHLRLAIEMRETLSLHHVRFIPVGVPNHRHAPKASATARAAMIQSVIDNETLRLDQRELERDGVSYTIDTLISLRSDFPQAALCLILGADSFGSLTGWHRWQELFEYCHIVVATRPGSGDVADPELIDILASNKVLDSSELHRKKSGCVFFQDILPLAISSTDIRKRCAKQLSINYLVAPKVEEIIIKKNLYRDQKPNE